MKKVSIVILVFAGGFLAYWLGSPIFINKEVREKAEEIISGEESVVAVARGMFIGADNFHKASGFVKMVKVGDKYFVRLEDDFMVTNGPDLFVHFGKDGAYDADARIAALKGNIGGQNYEVPADLNPLDYNEVWIWCRAFSVPFGKAELSFVL